MPDDQMRVFDGTKLKELVVALSQTDGFVNYENISMPNGKYFDKCTPEELHAIGRWLIDCSKVLKELDELDDALKNWKRPMIRHY